jgi:hypothetical protein
VSGIYKFNINLIYHRGFVYCNDFNFLHLTVSGKLLPIHYYYDLEEVLLNYIKNYNLKFLKIHDDNQIINKNII